MTRHLLRGTPDEKARMAKVEQVTGIDLDAFMLEVATTDPFDKTGACIFCKGNGVHWPPCQWVELRAALGIDGGAA